MIEFYKYSATGNDFILIDNRQQSLLVDDVNFWKFLCQRRTGVGADGVLLCERSSESDFSMKYINCDGSRASMCGNGARSIAHFVHHVLQLKDDVLAKYQFHTDAGLYTAEVDGDFVKLQMTKVKDISKISLANMGDFSHALFMNTGVAHAVFEVDNVKLYDVAAVGRDLAHRQEFGRGSNVNFFSVLADNSIFVRSYELGVEDETLSCGTGATAAALACNRFFGWKEQVEVYTRGGKLEVLFNDDFSDVFLCGKVKKIFRGEMLVNS